MLPMGAVRVSGYGISVISDEYDDILVMCLYRYDTKSVSTGRGPGGLSDRWMWNPVEAAAWVGGPTKLDRNRLQRPKPVVQLSVKTFLFGECLQRRVVGGKRK